MDYLIRTRATVKFLDPLDRQDYGALIRNPTKEQKLFHPYTSEGLLNRHWDTYAHSCLPCDIKYDFIGKLETFSEDIVAIMKAFRNKGCADLFPFLFKTASSIRIKDTCYTWC